MGNFRVFLVEKFRFVALGNSWDRLQQRRVKRPCLVEIDIFYRTEHLLMNKGLEHKILAHKILATTTP